MEHEFRILGTSNTVSYFEFWEFECIENTTTTPLTLWQDDLNNTINVGLSVLPQNTVVPAAVSGYAVATSDIGRRPTKRCKNLWQRWRVTSKKKAILPAGAAINVKFTSPGYAISHEELLNSSATYMAGLSRHYLIFQTSELVYDNAGQTQPIGMGSSSSAYRWVSKMKFSMPPSLRWYYHIKTNGQWDAASARTEYAVIATANQGRVLRADDATAETITAINQDT